MCVGSLFKAPWLEHWNFQLHLTASVASNWVIAICTLGETADFARTVWVCSDWFDWHFLYSPLVLLHLLGRDNLPCYHTYWSIEL